MREIFLKIRDLNNMMTLTASNNFIGYEGEHLETVLKIQDNNIFDGFGIFIKFQNKEDVYISERLTIKDGFYEFIIPQLLLKKGRIDAQLLLTENNPNKSDDIQIIKESSIYPFICRENIEQKNAQTIADDSKGLFVFKVNGDGGSYLGDDGKYHSLSLILPKPDWNETDETSIDYIKNKPKTADLDDIIDMLTDINIVAPIITNESNFYITNDDKIYIY